VDSTPPVYYGLDGAEEAAAYLRDDVLGDRLVTAAGVVREHVTAHDLRVWTCSWAPRSSTSRSE